MSEQSKASKILNVNNLPWILSGVLLLVVGVLGAMMLASNRPMTTHEPQAVAKDAVEPASVASPAASEPARAASEAAPAASEAAAAALPSDAALSPKEEVVSGKSSAAAVSGTQQVASASKAFEKSDKAAKDAEQINSKFASIGEQSPNDLNKMTPSKNLDREGKPCLAGRLVDMSIVGPKPASVFAHAMELVKDQPGCPIKVQVIVERQ